MTESLKHISKHYKSAPEPERKESENQINRRDFLKFLGLSAATITLIEACRKNPVLRNIPEKKAINRSGKINWYSSCCSACPVHCSIRVKCYEGVPVSIEGNPSAPVEKGRLCTYGKASLLSLYSDNRIKGPTLSGKSISWNDADLQIRKQLDQISKNNGKTVVLSHTINSPSTLQLINDFITRFPGTEHIVYDPVSASGMLNAYERYFGRKIIPDFKFGKSKVIISFNADFLNSWLSPAEYSYTYSATRNIERKLDVSNHIQFESVLTGTGAIADDRIAIDPSEEGIILLGIYNQLAEKSGNSSLPSDVNIPALKYVKPVSELLWKNKGRSIVVSANTDTSVQLIICGINSILGNYGRTIDLDNPVNYRQGNDDRFSELTGRMETGEIKGLIIMDADPCADSHDPENFRKQLQKTAFSVLLGTANNLTSEFVIYNCPASHFFESWNDHQPSVNAFCLSQPVISPIFNTRQYQNSILAWIGKTPDFYSYLRDYWKNGILKVVDSPEFETAWKNAVRQGIITNEAVLTEKASPQIIPEADARFILNSYRKKSKTEIILYESAVFRNGLQSDNLWLKELADPVTKICYDSYCVISPAFADENKIDEGDVLLISNTKSKVELPAAIIPGIAPNTIGIPLLKAFKSETNEFTGSAFGMFQSDNPNPSSHQFQGISFRKTGKRSDITCTQIHQQLKKETYIRDFNIDEYLAYPISTGSEYKKEKKYQNAPHKWVMVVDLNLCTGCSACVIGCQSENNIPTVGRKEVSRNRQMHWLRVDKYYEQDKNGIMKVHFLPVMCQQCEHAPCEPVCPVSATSHSQEGLNQQNYQRCIGARFCASNCPYDVRRFNFDQYYGNNNIKNAYSNETGKLSVNPEVSVRSRGVIEKCSFCIQRIQDARVIAKNSDKPIIDGSVTTACEKSCPANAIIFGDCYDKSSRVYHLIKNKRAFTLLPELNTKPSVYYMAKVRKPVFKNV